ncbi:MAG: recombinase family protein, partial [Candidatus Woesebacteria bacterium]
MKAKLKGYPVIYEGGKKAIIYLRVSTEEQVDNFSLDTQEEICRKEAVKRGYEIIDVFREEGKSAKTILGRPVLINLLEYCRKNKNLIQAVFVYRLDRVSRQTSDYLAIRKKLADNDISIVSSTEPTGDSPTEKLVETILAGFAQLDNDIRSERAKNGLRARFLSGLISGRPPIGYVFQAGFAVKDIKTWNIVKDGWELMATGTKSLNDIAKVMTDQGLRIQRGNREYKIRAQTANRIFRQKFYAGKITSETYPEEVQGQHTPMITEEQYYKVQAIIDGRNPNKIALAQRTHENTEFPLRRIVKCANCGVGLTGAWSKGKMGKKYAYYWCASKCNYKCIPASTLEDTLITLLHDISPKEATLTLFLEFMYKCYHNRLSRLTKIKNEADKQIQDLKLLRQTLVEKNLSGIYSDDIFKEQNRMIEDKMTRAQILKNDATLTRYNIDAVTSFVKTIFADLGETYKRSTIGQLKVLLGSIFPFGVAWDYSGTLNPQISPLFQYIQHFDGSAIPSGAG